MSRLAGLLRNPRRVLVLGLACALAVAVAWLLRSTAGATPEPATAPEGTTGTAAGVEWRLVGLAAAETVPSGLSSVEPVPGAVFVLARFDYAGPAGRELGCRVTLLGEGREWTSRFHTPSDAGVSAGCDGRPAGTAEVLFEIPRRAVGEVRGLEVVSGDGVLVLQGTVQ